MGRLVRDAQREPIALACRGENVAVVVSAVEWRRILGELRGAPAIECPCCGDDTFEADAEGLFHDGQEPTCGCPAWISCDAGTEPFAAWDDSAECAACAARGRDS